MSPKRLARIKKMKAAPITKKSFPALPKQDESALKRATNNGLAMVSEEIG